MLTKNLTSASTIAHFYVLPTMKKSVDINVSNAKKKKKNFGQNFTDSYPKSALNVGNSASV